MARHDVGDAIMRSAEVWWERIGDAAQPSKEDVTTILEVACRPWEDHHVSFDDDVTPGTPLGRMVAIAFDATPDEVAAGHASDGSGESAWDRGPWDRFRSRFGF